VDPQTADDLHVAVVHRKTLATIAESADHHHITITIQLYGQTLERPAKLRRQFLISSQSFVTARPD
jgi:hypothetical protein